MEIKITEDHTQEVISEMEKATARALEIIGAKVEKYAKALCPVGTSESTGKKSYRGGTLRNSITHSVDEKESTVTIGSNVVYAPFVELGTGPHFNAPPQWEQFKPYSKKGGGHGYVYPRPYLRPAVEDHLPEYKDIIENELKG